MQSFAQLGPIIFGNGLMWLWGLAAALPLLIHLLNRRQYREETWAAMEYLLRAMRKNSRRIQIEQLLLLIIRALILVAAALAWMDLMWSSSRLAGMALIRWRHSSTTRRASSGLANLPATWSMRPRAAMRSRSC
jgi:hypothetical protein